MYRNKYICLLKYIDTLPPPSELGKISILITSLHITREYKLEINWAQKKKKNATQYQMQISKLI